MPSLQSVKDKFLDFGEVIYMVDSDYRTGAQGWSRADRTGPLDLYLERAGSSQFNYVFRTADYATDRGAMQAAIDEAIDFRQDCVFFTPGNYSIGGTALSVNVPDLRLLGPRCSSPVRASVIMTDTLGSHVTTTDADRLEVGYMQFVPLTAATWWSVATGSDQHHWHDFFFNTVGVTANAATQMFVVDGTWDNTVVENFVFHTAGASGPLIELDGTVQNLIIRNFHHYHRNGALSVALLDIDSAQTSAASLTGTGIGGIYVGHGRGNKGGSGATVSHLIDVTAQTSTVAPVGFVEDFIAVSGYCTTAILVTSAGNEFGIVNCGLSPTDGSAAPTVNTSTDTLTVSWARMYPFSS